eukprot:gene823-9073_t
MSDAKKRKTSRQLTKDDADEEEETVEAGVFQKAPEDVLKQRKIVKVKRRGTAPKPEVVEEEKNEKNDSAPKISWSLKTNETKTEEKKPETNGKEEKKEKKKEEKEEKPTGFNFDFTPSTEKEEKKENGEKKEKKESPSKFNFNFSDTPSFSFNTNVEAPTFSFGNEKFDFQGFSGLSNTESSFSFSTVGDDKSEKKEEEASLEWKEEYTPEPIQETSKPIIDLPTEPVKTGEEEDTNVFQSRVKLYEYITADEKSEWLERGVGVIKLNQMPSKTDFRLVMRTEATHRLILNFKLFPDLKASAQSDKKVTVNGINDSGKPTTYLIRFSKPEAAEDFIKNVEKSTPSK